MRHLQEPPPAFSLLTRCSIKKMLLDIVQKTSETRIPEKQGRTANLYENAMCVIPSFTKVSWVKHGRHYALWIPQGSHPGIGMLHAGYPPDNEKSQNGVWGR